MANSLLQGLAGGARGMERALQLMVREKGQEQDRASALDRLQAQLKARRELQGSSQTFTAEQNRLSREATQAQVEARLESAIDRIRTQGEEALKRLEVQSGQSLKAQEELFRLRLQLEQRLQPFRKELAQIRNDPLSGPTRAQVGSEMLQAREEGESAALQSLITQALVEERASDRATLKERVFGRSPVTVDDVQMRLSLKTNRADTVEGRAFWLSKHPEWEAQIKAAGIQAMNQRAGDLGVASPDTVQEDEPIPPEVQAEIDRSSNPQEMEALARELGWDEFMRIVNSG